MIEPLLEATEPQVIVEIGALGGLQTTRLLEFATAHGATLHSIDPAPTFEPAELRERHGDAFVFHLGLSLNVLSSIDAPDAVLIDGDHNWYTVIHELRLLARQADHDDLPFPLVMLHDTGWPYGRRDLYYDPETIPPIFRQPYRRAGLHPDSPEPLAQGGLNRHLNNSIYEHALHNGVMTAVEDFVSEYEPAVELVSLPGLHGFMVLAPEARLAGNERLRSQLERTGSAEGLREHAEWLERERIDVVLAVKDVEREREHLRREAASNAAELEAERTKLQKREQELAVAVEKRRNAQASFSSAREELARVQEELAAATAARTAAEESLDGAEHTVQAERLRRRRLGVRVEHLEVEHSRLAALEVEHAALHGEVDRLRALGADFEERAIQLRADAEKAPAADAARAEAEAERDRAAARVGALEEEARRLEAQARELSTALALGEQRAEQAGIEHARLAGELAEARAAHESLAAELAEAGEAVARLEQERDDLAAHSGQLAARAEEAQAEAEALTERAHALEAGHIGLQARIAALEAAEGEHERSAAAREDELARRRDELDRAGQDLGQVRRLLETRRQRADADVRALKDEIEHLRRERHDEAAAAAEALALRDQAEAEQMREAEALYAALRRRTRELEWARSELVGARDLIERVATSRAWRLGHGTMKLLRLLTLRPVRGSADGLELAAKEITSTLQQTPRNAPTPPPPRRRPMARPPGQSNGGSPRRPSPAALEPGPASPGDPPERRTPTKPGSAPSPLPPKPPAPVTATTPAPVTDALSEARWEADREAAAALPASRRRAESLLKAFAADIGPRWQAGSEASNERFRASLEETWAQPTPKVMVGTLHGFENEFERCRSSVARQSHPDIEHVVLSGLSKKDSVSTLMERFVASDADIMVKVDADMVLLDDDLVARVVEIFQGDPEIDLLQAAVLDFFSGQAMQGINSYRRSIDWRTERQDRLFTDKTFIDKNRRRVAWAPFMHAAIHSPDPSPLQSWHFGVHRGLKVLQPLSETFNEDQAAEQTLYVERTWAHFKQRRDARLALACLGFELALQGRFAVADLDHTSPVLAAALEEYEGRSANELEELVETARLARVERKDLEPVRAGRRKLYADAAADIGSIVMPLPHFGVFGGVNRFFQLAVAFEQLGVEVAVTKPDRDWALPERKKLPQTREDYPGVRTIEYSEALARSWDVVLCGDCTSGVMLTMPLFTTRLSAAYLLNGWVHREANARQIQLVKPDVVIANSSWAARFYRDLAPAVVPGGVDLEIFNPVPGTSGLEGPEPSWNRERLRVVAYGGRLKKRKRFGDVVAACTIAHHAGIPIELHVYDEREIGVDVPFALVHHGKLERLEVAELLRGMDLMLCAEQDAGWSNPTAEAMACGVPVVCTPAGTSDFAIDGRTALVVPIEAPEAMAAAIDRLWRDPALAAALRQEGLVRIQDLAWPRVAGDLLEVFRGIRRDRRRRRTLDARTLKHLDLEHLSATAGIGAP